MTYVKNPLVSKGNWKTEINSVLITSHKIYVEYSVHTFHKLSVKGKKIIDLGQVIRFLKIKNFFYLSLNS